ncbi:RNA polymerase sigma factor [Streptomyces phyllanthi]|uniref:RNA polymerase subunit sigma-70 n=1 Tax=Streptomyces phyllanthi TaxID=1803180 RepID=A0A5N8WDL2_9ACTN|nr:RNA polymerase subunit sigma-70 [Streptomyces phyllanthi]MPY44916.1 RNA polymerase subunit sigma-70 [Streptomyces phyllanthi]
MRFSEPPTPAAEPSAGTPEPSANGSGPSVNGSGPSVNASGLSPRAVEWYELTPIEVPEPPPLPTGPLNAAQAFEALYTSCAPALVRQAHLLTGRRALARESVERAFQLAWQRWPEVAVDPDPTGWVRAAAHEYALSPWHCFRLTLRRPEPRSSPRLSAALEQQGVALTDYALIDVLRTLPPPYRRALVLYDGLGLGLPETAAETEASTPATAGRLMYAREAVAACLPELADPVELRRRLADAVTGEGPWVVRPGTPAAVRVRGERRARHWTHAAVAVTALLLGAIALTVHTAPDHYEPPVAKGTPIRGVPPRPALGPLSQEQLELRARLRSVLAGGPERLAPEIR